MARLPRYAAPGSPQHVIQRGNNRSATFGSEADYRFFLACLESSCQRYECRLHAYVLMTNHIHLLISPTTASGVSSVLQAVGRRYVQHFNQRHQRTGTLWEGRFRATIVDTDQYLFTCHRYIELNPVRAGIARDPRGYRWSSHHANAYGEADALVTPHDKYIALGRDASERQSYYRALFRQVLSDADLLDIRDATQRGWALGTKSFRDHVATTLGRRAAPAKKGRRLHNNDAI